ARCRHADARRGDCIPCCRARRAACEPDRGRRAKGRRVQGGRVKRLLSGWAALVVVATIVFAAVSFILPGRRHVALDVYVLFLGAVGLAIMVRATRAASPDVHEPTLEDELDDP